MSKVSLVVGLQKVIQAIKNWTLENVSNVMNFRGAVNSLPTDLTNYQNGDVIVVSSTGKEYVLCDNEWIELGDTSAEYKAIEELQTGKQDKLPQNIGSSTHRMWVLSPLGYTDENGEKKPGFSLSAEQYEELRKDFPDYVKIVNGKYYWTHPYYLKKLDAHSSSGNKNHSNGDIGIVTKSNRADKVGEGLISESDGAYKNYVGKDEPNSLTIVCRDGNGRIVVEDGTKDFHAVNKRQLKNAISSIGQEDAVKYTPQTLTDAQKAQARANIGAGASGFSGDYNDLSNKPDIPDALADLTADSTHRTVTDAEKATWNAKSNFSGNYNDLTNKPTIPAAYSHPSTHPASMITGLATVATSGSYNDLSNKPSIPTVNNGTLTIQKNGTTVNSFSANSSSNITANITVPTKVSELTNDSHFITNTDTAASATKWDKYLIHVVDNLPSNASDNDNTIYFVKEG